ncbi:lipopolysaccharide biosynthesis protein [Acinetobacter baumannii]|uniref:lipopolysaccharide biosynthesis protein n=1 Tax=Acinetobacter calcoaceticus/baumannii complex TaxID=909768 RepID=UPI0023423094|nr:oligosaccharide flippase family protein [Acinetobacter baumannii]MDC5520437.1 oligosaccharide flippase family protein [Acinetobacter baumannii]MDH2629409.1 oligosaccharide flippase family protein [Acinetobacter baumannii]HDU8210439.1 oligosaccharide flippase family protein [Acinetobacter baumannii]
MNPRLLISKYKSIGVITSSLLVGAIITFIALPILTRLYSVKDFGQYGVALAIVSVMSTIANLRLDQAILIAQAEEKKSLIFESILLAILFCIISSGVMVFIFNPLMIFAINFGVLANIFIQCIYNYNFSIENEYFCACLNILRSLVVVIIQISFPFFYNANLLASYLISSLFIILLSLSYIFKYKIYRVGFSSFKGYKDFIFSNTPHALLNSFSHNLPYYVVSHFLSYQVAGFYSIVERTLRLPINLMSQTIRQFFIRKFNTKGDYREALKSSLFLSLVSLPFFLIFFALPESLYSLIFGSEWNGISKYFKILTLGYWAVFCNPPISGFLIAKRRSDILLKLQTVELIIKALFFTLIYSLLDDKNSMLYAIPLSLIFYNFSIYFAVGKMKKC